MRKKEVETGEGAWLEREEEKCGESEKYCLYLYIMFISSMDNDNNDNCTKYSIQYVNIYMCI